MTKAAKLRKLLSGGDFIVAPGAYDCLTAKLVENAGFDVVYMTGGGTAGAYLGVPDLGLMTMTEMVDNAGRMAGSIDIPLIADADTGYGNELNVIRTIREYEQRGVAALHIEDQVFPKRCGHFDGKDVIARADFIAKIRAAAQTRRDQDTVLIARTDALAVGGFDEAIERMNAAFDAGADVAFLEAATTVEQMAEIPRRLKGPCLTTQNSRGMKTPRVKLDDLKAMGFRIVIFPGLLSRHVFVSCREVLEDLKRTNNWPLSAREVETMMDYPGALGMERFKRWETEFKQPDEMTAAAE
jgi:2-methylisocitrate lyase-like PEP mutase family enzyme